MGLSNPWAIAIGAFALAAPVAIHLLTRPKPVSFPLSTLSLLQEVIQQRRVRSRIRDWLILLLRTVVVLLLALAIARPILDGGPAVPTTASHNDVRVILLDVSQSMSAGSGGARRIAQGRVAAIEFLDAMSGVEAALIFVGAQPRPVFEQVSPNLAALRQAAAETEARPERANVGAALQLAGKMLREAPDANRQLVVISDFQRSNWGSAVLNDIPEDTDIQFHAVTSSVSGNVGITDVRFASQPVVGGPTMIEVEVGNYSDQDAQVSCQVQIGSWQQQLSGLVPAKGTRTLSDNVTIDSTGWMTGRASLLSNLDVMAADDTRPFVVEVQNTPAVLLLSRQSPTAAGTSSWFLEKALDVALAQSDRDRPVVRIDPSRTAPANWPDADLYVIDHPGPLNQESRQRIAARVRRGRNLLYVASEMVDAMNLEQLGQSLGAGFQPPVQLVSTTSGRIRKNLFIRQVSARRDPFRILGDSAESALRPVRFGGGLATEATEEGLRDQILAALSDSTALLYVTGADAGRVSVLNADLGKSNWPVQPTFVPILGELVKELLRGQAASVAPCGQPLVRMLPADVRDNGDLEVGPADDLSPTAEDYGSWQPAGSYRSNDSGSADSASSLVWTWDQPTGPGVYQIRQGQRVVSAVATAAPAVESDLQALDQTLLISRIGTGRNVGYSDPTSDTDNTDQIWNWLIVACLLGLVSEIAMLRYFRV